MIINNFIFTTLPPKMSVDVYTLYGNPRRFIMKVVLSDTILPNWLKNFVEQNHYIAICYEY